MYDENCLFCKIIKGEIPSTKVYEDENVLAFKDINPVAPVHVIIIPKIHISSANEVNSENSECIKIIFEKIPEIAKMCGVSDSGYRLVNNCGEDAGQTVKHFHIHMIGGIKVGEKLL